MPVEFYDNLEATPVDDLTGFVEVERIYCFDWDCFGKFGGPEWQSLSHIYENLPGWTCYQHGDPSWFGGDEESPPFLLGSVEPPGLQVYGILPMGNWSEWDKQFRSAADGLPMRGVQ